jgi:hypothetical protein
MQGTEGGAIWRTRVTPDNPHGFASKTFSVISAITDPVLRERKIKSVLRGRALYEKERADEELFRLRREGNRRRLHTRKIKSG